MLGLDLRKSYLRPYRIRLGRGDRRGTTLRIAIHDNGQTPDLSGMSASVVMLYRREGHVSFPCSVSGNSLTCTIDERLITDDVDVAYVSISDGASTYSTDRFEVVTLEGVGE